MENRITVVLADANEEFRTALQQTLENAEGFDVVGSAADGLAAAQLVQEKRPQLLVMDLLLPGLDGFGVLEQLEKAKVQVKSLIVSALYRDQIVAQAMSRGVSFFMPKPCETASLLEQMRRAMNEGEESESESQSLEREVTAVIHEVGVPAHIKGYQYVREAIVIAVQDMDVINAVTRCSIRRSRAVTAPHLRAWNAPCAMRSKSHGIAETLKRSSTISGTRFPTQKESRPTASSLP